MKNHKRGISGLLLATVGIACTARVAFALPWVERLEGGSAAIQNSGDTSYRTANEGDRIGLDEAVLPSPRARMLVRCPNNTRRRVIPGRLSGIGIICPTVNVARRSRNENDLLLLSNGVFPYGLRVVDELPRLSWPDLAEVERYQVSLYRQEQSELTERIWLTETATTELNYDGPPLEEQTSYELIVEPITTSQSGELCGEDSDSENASGLVRWRQGNCYRAAIQKLSTDEAENLTEMIVSATKATGLDEITRPLALAYHYEAVALYGDVIKLVEPLVTTEEQPAAVYQLLADSYLRAGWIEQAQGTYEQAQVLATQAGDYQTRLEAKLGLAKVAAWQMQPEVAVDYLWSALWDVSYVRDQVQADIIVQWLNKVD